jgi:pimeloyl-ACP methyl ester carboxylesterase
MNTTMTLTYRTTSVDGLKVFYREAGDPKAPTVLLLHGFPTSSHMYRELIPALADRYHVVAPDLPGFGFTDAPDRSSFKYSFDHVAEVIERFTEVLGLSRYALYVFDYGAPVGFRLAIHHPERITALISQNGNAYREGLSEGWNPIQAYWKDPSSENRAALRAFLKPEATQWQYAHGVPTPERLSPDAWTLDSALLARPGNDEIQLDLFGDYQSNVALYPNSRNTCAPGGPRFSRYGARTIRFSCRPAPRPSNVTTRTPKSTCSMPVISRWKVRGLRSRQSSGTSSPANCRNKPAPTALPPASRAGRAPKLPLERADERHATAGSLVR